MSLILSSSGAGEKSCSLQKVYNTYELILTNSGKKFTFFSYFFYFAQLIV
ncbi:hypothetical protein HMPREF1548_05966 [Clostridium sp. KLE 1755]|nr:hypothetical protein HMPREF1548_05966 [Clostridium sp. KLE 1755]